MTSKENVTNKILGNFSPMLNEIREKVEGIFNKEENNNG